MFTCDLGDFPVLADSECYHEESQFTSTVEVIQSTEEVLDKMIDKGGYTGMGDHVVQGDTEVFETMGKEDSRAIYAEEMRSPSLLGYVVGTCPSCEEDLVCVSTRKAFGKSNQACECGNEKCGYKENR